MGNHNYIHQIQPEQLKVDHPYFKKAIVTVEDSKKVVKSKIHAQEKQYKLWKSKVFPANNKGSPLTNEYLYLPSKSSFQNDKGYCSSTGHVVNIYDYFSTILSLEIEKRRPQKQYFKQSQLWYLLYVLAAAKQEMSKLHERFGDIKPANVFIDQQKNIKVGCILSSPLESTSYNKLSNLENVESNFLLAPEDLVSAHNALSDNKQNTQSEIFSIGATILSAGILDSLSEVYDFKKLVFLEEAFKNKIAQWIELSRYSQIFKSIILNLVDVDPSKRIQFDQFWKFISRYSSNIKNKDPFIINHPPECLERGIAVIKQSQKKK